MPKGKLKEPEIA